MSKTARIKDANVNRGREGLRVVEDIVRFVLDDAEFASHLKSMRHGVTSLVKRLPLEESEFLNARDSDGDVGMDLNCASEDIRIDLSQIATANVRRSQEAMRVLEEMSKLYDAGIALEFKKMRFQLYQVEKEIMPRLMECQKRFESADVESG